MGLRQSSEAKHSPSCLLQRLKCGGDVFAAGAKGLMVQSQNRGSEFWVWALHLAGAHLRSSAGELRLQVLMIPNTTSAPLAFLNSAGTLDLHTLWNLVPGRRGDLSAVLQTSTERRASKASEQPKQARKPFLENYTVPDLTGTGWVYIFELRVRGLRSKHSCCASASFSSALCA